MPNKHSKTGCRRTRPRPCKVKQVPRKVKLIIHGSMPMSIRELDSATPLMPKGRPIAKLHILACIWESGVYSGFQCFWLQGSMNMTHSRSIPCKSARYESLIRFYVSGHLNCKVIFLSTLSDMWQRESLLPKSVQISFSLSAT